MILGISFAIAVFYCLDSSAKLVSQNNDVLLGMVSGEDCHRCKGTGTDPLQQTCRFCNRGKTTAQISVDCDLCSGTGSVTSSTGKTLTCPSCQGNKQKSKIVETTCGNCDGKGNAPMPCRTCGGSGEK